MAYYATASVAEAEELISVSGPETACHAEARSEYRITFLSWRIICDYCGEELYSSTSPSITVNLTQWSYGDHPGPFHFIAIYKAEGGSSCTVHVLPLDFELVPRYDSQPTIPMPTQPRLYIAGGVERYIPNGGGFQQAEYISNAFAAHSAWDEFSYTTDADHRSIQVSCILRPRVAFRFVKFICRVYNHNSSVTRTNSFSFTTQTMSPGSYIIRAYRLEQNPPSDVDLKIYAIYEYTGIVNLTVKAIPLNYGTVDVVSEQIVGSSPYVNEKNKVLVKVEKLLTKEGEGRWYDSGPNFDFQVTANDGVVAFKRWSDNGARSHRFTITAESQTLIAYFSENRLVFDPDNGNQLVHDPASKSLMYEHLE